ncbi:hypothetical protein L3V43_23120, partial [Pseudoalteromonas sp. L23]|nr:hypothetical protein [Pseudoalteromonas sp. L7]MCF7528528.1 hypothetical protein [Pseudoalteromonas sp. L23]
TFFARSIESVLTLFMMDSPNNCVCNYQFGALTPIWERPSHHPSQLASGETHFVSRGTNTFKAGGC